MMAPTVAMQLPTARSLAQPAAAAYRRPLLSGRRRPLVFCRSAAVVHPSIPVEEDTVDGVVADVLPAGSLAANFRASDEAQHALEALQAVNEGLEAMLADLQSPQPLSGEEAWRKQADDPGFYLPPQAVERCDEAVQNRREERKERRRLGREQRALANRKKLEHAFEQPAVEPPIEVAARSADTLLEPPTANRGGPAGPRPAASRPLRGSGSALAPAEVALPSTLVAPGAGVADPEAQLEALLGGLDAFLGDSPVAQSADEQVSTAAAAAAAPLGGALALAPMAPSSLVGPSVRSGRRARRSTAAAAAPAAAAAATAEAAPAKKQGGGKQSGNGWSVEAKGSSLLSTDEERMLAEFVKEHLRLEGVKATLTKQLGREPSMAEWAQADGWQGDLQSFLVRHSRGEAAKQMLVRKNMRLVTYVVRRWQHTEGVNMNDLISSGLQGLLTAVEKFDGAKGFKFSTYAGWWIRQRISREINDQRGVMRLPAHVQEAYVRIRRCQRELRQKLGRPPTDEQVAKAAGMDVQKVAEVNDALRTVQARSMDAPLRDGEGDSVGDLIEDERVVDADEEARSNNIRSDMEAVLTELTEREAGVIRMRFGLDDGKEMTLDEVGTTFNVTRERIRQIEAKALRKMRARQTARNGVLTEYLEGDLEGGAKVNNRGGGGYAKKSK